MTVAVRRGLAIVAALLVVEFFVVPTLVGAGKNLDLLGRIDVLWLVAGVALEAGSLLCYAILTRTLIRGRRPSLWVMVRITLSTSALSHVIPAGAAGSAGLGYRLLTLRGTSGPDAAFALATGAIGSAGVLNVALLGALLVSIPLAGLHPGYVTVLLLSVVALVAVYALGYLFTRGEDVAVRAVRSIGRRIPRVGADRLERAVRQIADDLALLLGEHSTRRRALTWAALNWLLDAASLWTFIAALGHYVNPIELFAAYGIANVLAVIPVTPAGLGVVEVTASALLVGFGVPRAVATLGVLGWRVVNFWLPIPLGAISFLSLRVPHRAGTPEVTRPADDRPLDRGRRV